MDLSNKKILLETYFKDRVPWADRFTPGKEYLNDHWKQLLEWRQWIEEEENDKKKSAKTVRTWSFPTDRYYQSSDSIALQKP